MNKLEGGYIHGELPSIVKNKFNLLFVHPASKKKGPSLMKKKFEKKKMKRKLNEDDRESDMEPSPKKQKTADESNKILEALEKRYSSNHASKKVVDKFVANNVRILNKMMKKKKKIKTEEEEEERKYFAVFIRYNDLKDARVILLPNIQKIRDDLHKVANLKDEWDWDSNGGEALDEFRIIHADEQWSMSEIQNGVVYEKIRLGGYHGPIRLTHWDDLRKYKSRNIPKKFKRRKKRIDKKYKDEKEIEIEMGLMVERMYELLFYKLEKNAKRLVRTKTKDGKWIFTLKEEDY